MLYRVSIGLSLALLGTACEGPAGPQGEPAEAGGDASKLGTIGPVGGATGPAGPQGPPGPSGTSLDGGVTLQVGCPSPCHGFNGVVAQFQTSVHYTEYLVNVSSATPETEWTTTGAACGNCHSIDALAQRAAGHVLTSDDGGVVNLASGDLQYRDPVTGALSTANYAGTATVAEVYCTTCHAVTNANDPHVTGVPWTPGSFPLVVSPDGGDIYVEKSPTTRAVEGTNAGNFGPGDTCMWCHRSRVDVTNYLSPKGNAITSVFWGPHEGPQADLFTGIGGYQYAGRGLHTQSTHEQVLSCVDCHMINRTDNVNVPDHSFNPNLLACAQCRTRPRPRSTSESGFESQVQSCADAGGDLVQRRRVPDAGRRPSLHSPHDGAARRRQLVRGRDRAGRHGRRQAPHAGSGRGALRLHPRRARGRLRRPQPEVHRADPLRRLLRAHRTGAPGVPRASATPSRG